MISDKKLERWCELLGASDSKFVFQLGIDSGVRFDATPPYPDLVVQDSSIVHVRRVVVQEIVVTATVPEDHDQAEIMVQRLVAELETGQELELMRTAQPVAESEKNVDMSVCGACGEPLAGEIDEFNTVVIEDAPYHRRCTK